MSSINQLLGTNAYISSDTGDSINIIEANSLCIDTSNNRIGINTIDPFYSIHVADNGINNDSSIYSYNIIIPNKLDVSYIEVSNNFKLCNSINDNSSMEIYYVDSCLNVILNNLPNSSIGLPNYALYHDTNGNVKIKIPS
tara:strand:- start:2020 stop:2439 length:420 start_codon:yes stop_codon:yes gene_type:complete